MPGKIRLGSSPTTSRLSWYSFCQPPSILCSAAIFDSQSPETTEYVVVAACFCATGLAGAACVVAAETDCGAAAGAALAPVAPSSGSAMTAPPAPAAAMPRAMVRVFVRRCLPDMGMKCFLSGAYEVSCRVRAGDARTR